MSRERERKLEEVRDRRRFVADRPTEAARKPDYRQAVELGTRDRAEGAKRLRSELGLSVSDHEIERRARARTEEATRRLMRENGDG